MSLNAYDALCFNMHASLGAHSPPRKFRPISGESVDTSAYTQLHPAVKFYFCSIARFLSKSTAFLFFLLSVAAVPNVAGRFTTVQARDAIISGLGLLLPLRLPDDV